MYTVLQRQQLNRDDPRRYCGEERRRRDNAANTGIAVSIILYGANFEALEADANVELLS